MCSHCARTLEHDLGEFCGQGGMEECVTSGLSLFQGLSDLHITSKDGSHRCFPSPPGYIKNTEKLNYGKEHQYKLTVTAYDCGKKRATEDVLVKISVKPTCSPGWQGELQSLCFRTHSENVRAVETHKRELSFFSPAPIRGASQAGATGLNTSPARGRWLSSQASTWRPVTSPSPQCRSQWSWRPATSGKAATETPTLRSPFTGSVVRRSGVWSPHS